MVFLIVSTETIYMLHERRLYGSGIIFKVSSEFIFDHVHNFKRNNTEQLNNYTSLHEMTKCGKTLAELFASHWTSYTFSVRCRETQIKS